MEKKLTLVFTFFVLTTLAQENKISAIDYFLTNKNGYIGETSAIYESNSMEVRDTIIYTKNQSEIKNLKNEIIRLESKINYLENLTYEKNKDIYASCITTVPYLKNDLANISSHINIYKNSIKGIKDRNLLNNDEFKKWFSLYSEFIEKQSDIKIDLNKITNLNTSNVVDFILSSISTILTNTKSSKELRKSSKLMFQLLSEENTFYKNFEIQIETKYLNILPLYENLTIELNDYIKYKEKIIPQELLFNPYEVNNFVSNLNAYYDEKNSTEKGRTELRDDKIAFYGILEKYLNLKNEIEDLNIAFEKMNEKTAVIATSIESQDTIEIQLNRVFLLLHGL